MDNAILENILRQVRPLIGQGKVADYIPALATVDGSRLGIAICTVDGQHFQAGDAQERFSIQSISKVLISLSPCVITPKRNLATRRQRSVWITVQFLSATGNGAGYTA